MLTANSSWSDSNTSEVLVEYAGCAERCSTTPRCINGMNGTPRWTTDVMVAVSGDTDGDVAPPLHPAVAINAATVVMGRKYTRMRFLQVTRRTSPPKRARSLRYRVCLGLRDQEPGGKLDAVVQRGVGRVFTRLISINAARAEV